MKPNTKFEGCSSKVAAALGPDVMKSVKYLIPDLLSTLPVLLYQGLSRACIDSDFLCMQGQSNCPMMLTSSSCTYHDR